MANIRKVRFSITSRRANKFLSGISFIVSVIRLIVVQLSVGKEKDRILFHEAIQTNSTPRK